MSERRLIVLDPGRIDATTGISELLVEFEDVHVLDPLDFDMPADGIPSLHDRAVELADRIGDQKSGILIGHCTNTALAFELASVLKSRGQPLSRIAVFGPAKVDREAVVYHYARLLVSSGLSDEDAETLAGREWDDLTAGRVRLRGLALTNAAELGLEDDEAETFADVLCERYTLWLGHLAGSLHAGELSPACPVDVIDDDIERGLRVVSLIAPGVEAAGHWSAHPISFDAPASRRQFAELVSSC
jgi:hypothetical protein